MTQRAKIGFGSEMDDFDPDAWKKLDKEPRITPDAAKARAVAEASGFASRQSAKDAAQPAKVAPVQTPHQQRRRRTGRNVQFNLKARPETIEAFCRVADERGIGLGEALELATDLMVKHHNEPERTG